MIHSRIQRLPFVRDAELKHEPPPLVDDVANPSVANEPGAEQAVAREPALHSDLWTKKNKFKAITNI